MGGLSEARQKPRFLPAWFEVGALEKWFTPKFTDTKAIELACGTGFWTQFLARTTRGMVALDAFPDDLAIAESRVPVDKVKFMTGDAFKLSLDLGCFNAGFAAHWMSSVPRVRRMAFFQALSTVMVPGAEVVLLDYAFVEGVSTPIADTEAELRFALGNHGVRTKLTQWDYFWAFEYVAC